MVRKEKLADEELSLKEKYALLRKQREQSLPPTEKNLPKIAASPPTPSPPPKEKKKRLQQPVAPSPTTPPSKESEPALEVTSLNDKAKIELAKKALASSLQKESHKESGFKRREPIQRSKPETPEEPESVKRQKTESENETQLGPKNHPYSIRDRRDKRSMVLADEVVEGEYYPTTIFVGDLPEGISETELEKHFSPFGQIECIRLITPKNFAFIKFNTREGADHAITSMNATTIYNIPIRVSKARIHTAQHTWRKSWDGWSIQDKHNVTSQSFEAPVVAPTVYTPPPIVNMHNTDGRVALETPRGNDYSDLVRDRTLLRYDDL